MKQNLIDQMYKRSHIRLYLLILFSVLSPVSTLSQSDDTTSAGESSIHSFYTGLGYGSNMIYLGSTMSGSHPFAYSALAYCFNNELTASVSGFHLKNFDPYLAFYSLSLNYSHVFNSWLDISAGIYRYQVASSLVDSLFSNFTYSDLTLGIDWKLLYSKLSFGGIFMKDPQTYFQVRNSRYFQTPGFFRDKAFISFDPYVNLLFGTLITAETTDGTSIITTTQQYKSPFSTSPGNTGSSSSGNGYGSGNGSGSGYGSGSSSTTTTTTSVIPTTTTTYSKKFSLIEIEFGLPVAFNTDFMTIEAEAGYILPTYSDNEFPGPKGFIFMLSGFFRIF